MSAWIIEMKTRLVIYCFLSLLLFGCAQSESVNPSGNAIYYWRTNFELSDAERVFLKENDIQTLYVKFFDIVADRGELRPEATLVLTDSFPRNIKIVPTVFIEPRAFSKVGMSADLAEKIVSRVDSMMIKNGYQLSDEIQVDFDWTESNRQLYFGLLDDISRRLHLQGRKLSTTIRLHQLSQPAPPVDYGSLMVYNTGAMTSPHEKNSILSTASVRPYLKYLKKYDLPLVTALPIYSWDLLFHNGEFLVIARGLDRADTTRFRHVRDNIYVARQYGAVPASSSGNSQGARILPGDVLRHEGASFELLDSVASALEEIRPGITDRVILYHLDENSFNNYNSDEIKQIYHKR